MKKMFDLCVFLALTYPYGIVMGIIFRLLVIIKKIRVLYWKRFPHWEKRIILVSNHPSLLEPFLLPALFLREYFLHPFQYAPWSTPDKANFYDSWYWFWLRPRAIPIDRKKQKGNLRVFLRIKEIVSSGGIIILFPEGGRTFKGKEFLCSKTGKKLRVLKTGIGWLVLNTQALVIPVWVEGTDKILPNRSKKLFSFPRLRGNITIKIGRPLRFHGFSRNTRKKVTQRITNALLELADEEE